MSLVTKLLKMKKQLEEAKTDKAEATGALKVSLAQLESEFDVDSLEKAQKLYKKLLSDEEALTQELEEVIEQLEDDYEWD